MSELPKLKEIADRVGQTRGVASGVCGQTVEAVARATFHRISAWDLDALYEIATDHARLVPVTASVELDPEDGSLSFVFYSAKGLIVASGTLFKSGKTLAHILDGGTTIADERVDLNEEEGWWGTDHTRLVEALDVAREVVEATACECTGRCELMEWLPADNCQCSRAHARAALARIDALQPRPRDEQHEAGSGEAPDEPDAPV